MARPAPARRQAFTSWLRIKNVKTGKEGSPTGADYFILQHCVRLHEQQQHFAEPAGVLLSPPDESNRLMILINSFLVSSMTKWF
jgi:hypothetical protein